MKTDSWKLGRATEKSASKIAARLTEFREDAGLSIQEIVDATGLSRGGIDKMEGRRIRSSPSVQSIELYVTACGRTLAEFFEPWARKNGNGQRNEHNGSKGKA